jgi:hypothetical protein
MEQALQQEGIVPTVIRSDDMLAGSLPIRHSNAVVIQLHGDYKDVRSLNTPEELGEYSVEKNALLQDVFSEYGLIVCGWSARYDTALRSAIQRNPCKWYSTYWVEPNELSSFAQDIVSLRRGKIITASANQFFSELEGKVFSLAQFDRVHPLTIEAAVAYIKRLIPQETMQIELEDYIKAEADKAFEKIKNAPPISKEHPTTYEEWHEYYIAQLESTCVNLEPMLHIILALCWYGNGRHNELITDLLNRWAYVTEPQSEWLISRLLPVLLIIYVCGIAATKRENWKYFKSAVVKPIYGKQYDPYREYPLIEMISKRTIFKYEIYDRYSNIDPISNLIRKQLYPLFASYFPLEKEFLASFQHFELLLAIISLYVSSSAALVRHDLIWGVNRADSTSRRILSFWQDGGKQAENWTFLKQVFDGNTNSLLTALENYENRLKEWKGFSSTPAFVGFKDAYLSNAGV